MVVIFFHPPNN